MAMASCSVSGEEEDALAAEVRRQREQTVRLMDLIASKQAAEMAGMARRLEEGLRGMAGRLSEVERAVDQLRGSVRETREVAGRQEATLAKHREAVQRLYEELRVAREEQQEDRRQRQGDRLRRELYGDQQAYKRREQPAASALNRLQDQLEEMQRRIDRGDAAAHADDAGMSSSRDDHHLRQAVASLQRKVSALDDRLQRQATRHAEEVQLLARSEEASSALHEEHRKEAAGLGQRFDALELAVKELGRHMQQRDRVGRDVRDMCEEHEQAIESIKHALQLVSREIVGAHADAG